MASTNRLQFVLYLVMIALVIQMYVAAAEIGAPNTVGLQRNEMKRKLLQTIDCNAACGERCKEASRHNMCLRACGTCCARCNCVPPGTSGNTDLCPCYASLKTHGGRPKCP